MQKHIIDARTIIGELMDRLKVKGTEKALINAAYGFFTSTAVMGQLQRGLFTLLLADDPLNALANLASNVSLLFEHPAVFVCMETHPSTVVTKLLSIVSGVDLSDLRAPAYAYPSVDQAAGDIWNSPLSFWCPQIVSWKSLDAFAAHATERGIETVFIDAPSRIRLSQKTLSAERDLPLICDGLCRLARRHHLSVIGGHTSRDLMGIAALADQAIRFEDLGDIMRIGIMKRGEERPTFTLAEQAKCGRIQDRVQFPWGSTAGRLFAKARKTAYSADRDSTGIARTG